jgi:acyl dehydratase
MPELGTMPVEFGLDRLGRVIEAPPFVVTRDHIDAYAAAVDAPASGLAAPLFAVVPCYPILFAAVDTVTPATVRDRLVHGSHEVTIDRLIAPGDALAARGFARAVTAVRAGALVHVDIEVADATGTRVALHRLTAVVRGVAPVRTAGEPPGESPGDEVPAVVGPGRRVPVEITADQPDRYAEATGDRNAIHVDPAAARAAGFPGVIAHGLGVLGLATSALVRTACVGDPGRLGRIGARFAAPVLPGQTMTLQLRQDGQHAAFELETHDGAPALRAGHAVLC